MEIEDREKVTMEVVAVEAEPLIDVQISIDIIARRRGISPAIVGRKEGNVIIQRAAVVPIRKDAFYRVNENHCIVSMF